MADRAIPAHAFVKVVLADDRQRHPPGRYYLLIGNVERFSDQLEPLERHLYEFAGSEGYL